MGYTLDMSTRAPLVSLSYLGGLSENPLGSNFSAAKINLKIISLNLSRTFMIPNVSITHLIHLCVCMGERERKTHERNKVK